MSALRNVYVGQTQPDPVDNKQTFFASDLGPVYSQMEFRNVTTVRYRAAIACRRITASAFPSPISMPVSACSIFMMGRPSRTPAPTSTSRRELIPDCNSDNRDGSSGGTGVCNSSQYMYGHAQGLLQGPIINPKDPNKVRSCYIPNAAIAWKQENGFYYPPAFHSRNLVFNNVDIRHFVIEPLFNLNTFQPNLTEIAARYCTWKDTIFEPFNDIDRQTVLNDDDGSLTGLLAEYHSAS